MYLANATQSRSGVTASNCMDKKQLGANNNPSQGCIQKFCQVGGKGGWGQMVWKKRGGAEAL